MSSEILNDSVVGKNHFIKLLCQSFLKAFHAQENMYRAMRGLVMVSLLSTWLYNLSLCMSHVWV